MRNPKSAGVALPAHAERRIHWIVEPERRILTVYRLEGTIYSVAHQSKQGESDHAPPLRVGLLFGEEPD